MLSLWDRIYIYHNYFIKFLKFRINLINVRRNLLKVTTRINDNVVVSLMRVINTYIRIINRERLSLWTVLDYDDTMCCNIVRVWQNHKQQSTQNPQGNSFRNKWNFAESDSWKIERDSSTLLKQIWACSNYVSRRWTIILIIQVDFER